MVFLALAILLVAAGASASTEEDCFVQSRSHCRRNSQWKEFPGSAEEFDAFCEYELPYYVCYTNYTTDCNQDSEAYQVIKKFEGVLRHACDKDTSLYKDIVRVLPCVKTNLDRIFDCHKEILTDEYLEDYRKSLSKHGIHNVTGENNIRLCLRPLYIISCESVSAGRECGEVAKNVMIDLNQLWQAPFMHCHSGVVDKLPAIVRAMEMQEEQIEVNKFQEN